MKRLLLTITSEEFMIYGGILILALFIYYFVTQWVHEIHKRNRYLEAQIKLLSKIAEKQGVNKDELEVIIRVAESPKTYM